VADLALAGKSLTTKHRLIMDEPTPKDLFLQSVNRCVGNEAFFRAFYERFLGSSEEIKDKFRFTDFDKQNKMLARSLKLCAGATAGEAESLAEITERATTHDRNHLDIEPRLYDVWLEAIVAAASEFDDEWTDSIEAAWRKILGHVVQRMIRQY
jgi:hemoglobin-like flavoprotein